MSKRAYDIVLFDLDGTLTDSAPGICSAIRLALGRMGIVEDDLDRLRMCAGPPLPETFSRYGLKGEGIDRAIRYFRAYYLDRGIWENAVFPGVPDMLKALLEAGYRLGVATTKLEASAVRVLNKFGLLPFFDHVAGAIDGGRVLKEDVIAHLLAMFGVTDKSLVLMIGDRKYDVVGARQAGIDCMSVGYGYAPPGELDEFPARFHAEFLSDIIPLLDRQAKRTPSSSPPFSGDAADGPIGS